MQTILMQTIPYFPTAHLLLDGFRLELIKHISPRSTPVNPATPNVGSAHIAFFTEDVERSYRELTGPDVRFKGAPMAATSGRPRVACFLDPDGTILEFSEEPPPGRS